MSVEILLLAVCVLCAVVGYRLATARRRNAVLWAFACFVFPPALGILFITPRAIADSEAFKALDARWDSLTRYDPDVRAVVERIGPLGPEAVDRFKRLYAEQQDKGAIPLIVADIEAAWANRADQGLRPHETHKGVEILIDPTGLFHVEGRTTRDLATARVMATGAARRR